MDQDEYRLIKEHALFSGLSDKDAEKLLRDASPRDMPKGYSLFMQDDPVEYFYFIFDGWVKISRETLEGNEAIIGVFSRGDTIVEAMAFIGGDYPANAEVIENARILPIRTAPFINYLKERPEVSLSMLSSLSRRMHLLVGEIESLKTQTASQRVCQFLLRRCTVREGAAVIALPYDKTVISGRLGIQPESLSRILSRLRKYGIKTERERVIISDVALLERYCSGEADLKDFAKIG
ncbi:MAG: Crp/Fnr family transcriptional regulator [Rhodospirillales bacterium]|jgi:CRP/FNR family transcriptional regulator, dissimilatory nitrate respiration regulator|nr:Crp/Fnr family transcriptional regulator [Rhodospirillales bacterium]